MNCKFYFMIMFFTGLYSCKTENREDQFTPESIVKLPDTVSFSKHIQPILQQHCSTSGCHSGKTPAGNLNLETTAAYTSLMRRGSGYIDTLQPDFSVLYGSITSVNNPMPPSGKLPEYEIELIYKWIVQKAKNN